MQDIDSNSHILIRGTQIVIKEELVKSTAYVMERKMSLLTDPESAISFDLFLTTTCSLQMEEHLITFKSGLK